MGQNTILETHLQTIKEPQTEFLNSAISDELNTSYLLDEIEASLKDKDWKITKEKLFSTYQKDNENLTQISFYKKKQKLNSFFTVSQKWLGHVVDITTDTFTAKLDDLTNGGSNEFTEFDIDEISPGDLPLLKRGAAFYWSVGYATEMGQRKKQSLIIFQRLPDWTEDEYNEAIDKADDLFENIKWQ
jgi:hypothetical protein